MNSDLAVGVGDGTGEAGRLAGLRNEGVLMVCIVQGIEVWVLRRYIEWLCWREPGLECWTDGFCEYGIGRLGHPQQRTEGKLSHEMVNRDPG